MEYFTLSGFLTFLIWIQRFFGFFPKKKKKRSQTFIDMNARWYDTHSAVHKNELLTKGFLD